MTQEVEPRRPTQTARLLDWVQRDNEDEHGRELPSGGFRSYFGLLAAALVAGGLGALVGWPFGYPTEVGYLAAMAVVVAGCVVAVVVKVRKGAGPFS